MSIGSYTSEQMQITYGVPQGSTLGPLLFHIYMLPLPQIFKNNKISYHSYSDDTQIYIIRPLGNYSPRQTLIECIDQIGDWMCQNFEDKTEEDHLRVSAEL